MSTYYNLDGVLQEIEDSLYAEWVSAANPKATFWQLAPPKPSYNASTTSCTWGGSDWVLTPLQGDPPESGAIQATGFAAAITLKTTAYTTTAEDYTVRFDSSLGSLTCTLETAVGAAGRIHVIVKDDASANEVIVDGNALEMVGETDNIVLTSPGESVAVQSDGANWIRIAL